MKNLIKIAAISFIVITIIHILVFLLYGYTACIDLGYCTPII